MPVGDVAVVGLDGIEGCGKTSVVTHLRETWGDGSFTTRVFGDPRDSDASGRPVGTWLYEHALAAEHGWDDTERQLSLALAARRHYRSVLPELREMSSLILSDRSYLSVLAYAAAHSPDALAMARWAISGLATENVVIWIDTSENVASRRLREKELRLPPTSSAVRRRTIASPTRVRAEFRRLADDHAPRVMRVDGDGSLDTVVRRVRELLAGRGIG